MNAGNATVRVLCLCAVMAATLPLRAEELNFIGDASPILHEYCVECHGDDNAEAHINLEGLLNNPRYGTQFRTWEKVVAVLGERQMPPDDMPQPDDDERMVVIQSIHQQLEHIAHEEAGTPGRVVMRRLTSAEYDYTIQDLTGLQLDLGTILDGDAVGGEGFTNVGDVQFVQDSTLERYLEAARLVASHAVIGSGPLQFFESPGKTGQELSAIHRIQGIYRAHGFRTAAGEGGEPFGLELYPKAFYVAWKYHHRNHFGLSEATLGHIAADESLNPRFAQHIWTVLQRQNTSFPLSEIVTAWRELPAPSSTDLLATSERQAHDECSRIASLLRNWQGRLAGNTGDDEEAALLTTESIRLEPAGSFRAVIDWQDGDAFATVHLITASATGEDDKNAMVIWRRPTIQFRREDRRRLRPVPLATLIRPQSHESVTFGPNELVRHADESDLVVGGNTNVQIDFHVPQGAIGARLSVQAELQTDLAPNAIVRCTIRDGFDEGDTAADTGEVSTILGQSDGAAFNAWAAGVVDFASALPDVSHREPTPSDRDPIPAPFDNSYNNPERNDFHYSIKYHRDDDFLVKHLLDDATRVQLDHAWHDLLSSFDYHDTFLKFVAVKSGHDLGEQTIANLQPDWIAHLPDDYRSIALRLVNNYFETRAAVRTAEPGQVADALRFAHVAWRRPLSSKEQGRLHAFYDEMRESAELGHDDAIRALVTRILVSPEFLYRIERPKSDGIKKLSQWELASRLSYFFWSSVPDEELLEIAARGGLDSRNELERQTRRMLRDPKARRFATEFFGQWFGFYRFDKFGGIDATRFPQFNDELKSSMYDEAISFFEHIVRHDRSVNDVLFAEYSYWNHDLGRHYGLSTDKLEKLTNKTQLVSNLRSVHRGGLLSLGVVHATTSAPLRTSAVKRGDWILRRVLGTPVPPPPADVGSIPADEVASDGKTVRERLIAHRQDSACMNCHTRMDPLGFAMENFDPVGRWRERYRDGQLINATGTLANGAAIEGFDGLQAYLRDQLPKFHRTFCSKLLGYALGRREILTDRQLIATMMDDLKNDASISQIATRIVTSTQFRTKRGVTGFDSAEGAN